MSYDVDGIQWLLSRIKRCDRPNKLPTHQNIWQGCYDVWHCEQDRADAINIPRLRMKEAEDLGFIKNTLTDMGKYKIVLWSITEVGEEFFCQPT